MARLVADYDFNEVRDALMAQLSKQEPKTVEEYEATGIGVLDGADGGQTIRLFLSRKTDKPVRKARRTVPEADLEGCTNCGQPREDKRYKLCRTCRDD